MTINNRKKVLKALEDGRYTWRTINGIAAEVKVPKAVVVETINALSLQGVVARSSTPSTTGEPLFTSRKHLRETASVTGRLIAALKNRAG